MKTTKQFELEYNRHLYFGDYDFEENKLVIDEVRTYDDGERIEVDSINDAELFDHIYLRIEKEKSDEKATEAEYQAELRYSIAEEKADSIRKYK